MAVLKLNQQGMPSAWIGKNTAASMLVKGLVTWSFGDTIAVMRGGVNRDGVRSTLDIPAVIATRCQLDEDSVTPTLTNAALFRRDNYQCMYCGGKFHATELTRDHIVPRGQGGPDVWTNVVAACGQCNWRKGCRTPEQSGMALLAVPFKPNRFEYMYLTSRRIQKDQFEYLKTKWTNHRTWAA